MNQLVTINASLDDELAVMLALEFGIELEVVHPRTAEDDLLDCIFEHGQSRRTSCPGRRSSRSWATSTTARRRSWTGFASPTSSSPRAAASPSTSARTRSSRTAGRSRSSTRPGHEAFTVDACPRRQRDRHRGPGRRRRRRRDAPDGRGHRPRQGGRRADRGGAQQDRPAQRRHAVEHQQDLRRALAAGAEPGRVGRRHRGRQDLGDDRPGHPRPARPRSKRSPSCTSSRPTRPGRRPAPAWRPRSPRAAASWPRCWSRTGRSGSAT